MTRAERLFEILGGLEDELVEEAAQPCPARRAVPWRRWAALAACLLLAAGAWNLSHLRIGSASGGAGAAPQSGEIAGDTADSAGAVTGDAGPEENRVGSAVPFGQSGPTEEAAESGPAADVQVTAGNTPPEPAPTLPGAYDSASVGGALLEELNRDLAERLAVQGLPSSLPVYVDGQAEGPYPLISQEDAWAARTDADGGAGDLKAAEGTLCYAANGDGVIFPCWRFPLADGSTLDVPAVEARYLEIDG